MSEDRIFDVFEGRLGTPQTQADAKERIQWLVERVPAGSNVLEVGCSQGLISILLARKGCKVRGIDLDDESLAHARRYLQRENAKTQSRVEFTKTDFLSLGYDDKTWDVIVMSEVLEHVSDPEAFITHAVEILNGSRDDPKILVQVPFGIHPHPDHYHHFYCSQLLDLIPAGSYAEEVDIPGMRLSVVVAVQNGRSDSKAKVEALVKKEDKAFRKKEERYLKQVDHLKTRNLELERQKKGMQERIDKRDDRIRLLREKVETERSKVKEMREKLREAQNRGGVSE